MEQGLFGRTLGRVFSGKAITGAAISTWQGAVAQLPNLRYETFVREGYSANEVIFACIEEWCTDIAEANIQGFRNTENGPEVVEQDEVLDLINHPNPYLSGDDLLAGIELYKRIAGNAFLLKERSGAMKVRELWFLRPDRVRVIPSPETYIARYEYRIGPNVFNIPPRDIIHFKTRNPLDEYYGMPPLMAAAGRTDIDNFMRDVVKGYLNNAGIPAGILQVAGHLDQQEKELIRHRFRTEYGGARAGNIIVADDSTEKPQYTPMGMALGARGLVIPELDEIDESRLCMVYRVPQSLVGTRLGQLHGAALAARQSDRQFFTEQQLVPEWKSIASTFSMSLCPEFTGVDYVEFNLDGVRALSENQNDVHTRVRDDLKSLILSIQESREEAGYEREPQDDDIFLLPINVAPVTWANLREQAEPQLEPTPVPQQIAPGQNGQLPPTEELPPATVGGANGRTP